MMNRMKISDAVHHFTMTPTAVPARLRTTIPSTRSDWDPARSDVWPAPPHHESSRKAQLIRASIFALPILLATTALTAIVAPTASYAQAMLGPCIALAPPELPVYEQPAIPAGGYPWTPGHRAYGEAGYFWVSGTWVQPPMVGVLSTPRYWGWSGYAFNAGDWGPTSASTAASTTGSARAATAIEADAGRRGIRLQPAPEQRQIDADRRRS